MAFALAADGDSMRLTPPGGELRDMIEVDTNHRVAVAFDATETGEAEALAG